MLIIDTPKNLKQTLETARDFGGDAYMIGNNVQVEFDSDFSHMEMPLMNALMNQGEEVRQA